MIKIDNSREVQKISVEYDLYTPIDIKLGDWDNALESTVYWRTGDFQKSLIEIGIGKYNKEVRSITLVICDKVYESKKMNSQFQSTITGCPIVTMCNVDENTYVDENGSLKIYFEENSVYILFSEIEAINCMKNGNIEFLLDSENNWVGVCIKDITEKNLSILKSSLK